VATSKRKQAKRKAGRPTVGEKKATTMMHVAVDPALLRRLDEVAGKFKVQRSDLVRWLLEDAADGKWFPSHLRDLSSR